MVPTENANGNPYNTEGNRRLVPYNGIENVNSDTTLDNSRVTVIDTNKVDTNIRSTNLPENSQITTVMNKQGHVIETRNFFDNKFLDKVVKTTVNPKNVKIEVYLKDGNVKEIDPADLKDFRMAGVATILKAAGYEYPASTNERKDGLRRKPAAAPTAQK